MNVKTPSTLCVVLALASASATLPAANISGVSGASSVFSLRKLVDSYSGSAINVRLTSDSTSMDIGFDGSGNLDTAALLTFVGSGDGFVTRWYDQAEFGGDQGDGRDSSEAQHPRIVSSGTLVTSDNGKVALDFTGENPSRRSISMSPRQPYSR